MPKQVELDYELQNHLEKEIPSFFILYNSIYLKFTNFMKILIIKTHKSF